MLRTRFVAAAVLLLTGALSACGTRDLAVTAARSPQPHAAGATATPAPPTFAPVAVHVTSLASGGKAVSCDAPFPPHMTMDGPAQPRDLHALEAQSSVVAIATATEARGYWQRADATLPVQNVLGMDYQVVTATNFAIEQGIKGAPTGGWLQLVQPGAAPGTVATCPRLASVYTGEPLPTIGQRYLLFLQEDVSRHVTRAVYGALDLWPVHDGLVRSPFGGADVPLEQLVTSL